MRKTFAGRLEFHGAKVESEADDRHAYFVEVLERVCQLLKPHMEAGVLNDAKFNKPATNADSKDPLTNTFDILGVYEPSEAFLNAPDVAIPPRAAAEYVAEQQDTHQDAMFALVVLIHDYDRLRREIRLLWARYERGELDLAAVSVATNTAFELARSMEDDVKPLFDKFEGALHLLSKAFFIATCRNASVDATESQNPLGLNNMKEHPLAQTYLIYTTSALSIYAAAEDKHRTTVTYPGILSCYQEIFSGTRNGNVQKRVQVNTALLEMLPDIHFMVDFMGRGIVEDELIRGMDALMKDPRNVRLWFALAAQIYVDILQTLGPNCGRGHEDMKRESLRIKKSMLNVPEPSKGRAAILGIVTKWDTSPMMLAKAMSMKLSGKPYDEDYDEDESFRFLRRNPLHCGLWIHKMRCLHHSFGIPYSGSPGGVTASTQLYHALRQEKRLPDNIVWDDLETLWKMQGNNPFFIGDPPTDRKAHFKNFYVSNGTSVENFAPNRQNKKFAMKKANQRRMNYKGWTSLLFDDRLEPDGERQPMTDESIARVIDQGRERNLKDNRGKLIHGNREEAKEVKLNPTMLPAPDLIRTLAENIHAEVAELSFDYFTMHNKAWAFLVSIKDVFVKMFGTRISQYLDQETQLPYVVGYIFKVAAGRDTLSDREGEESVLNLAAEILRTFLLNGHGRVIKAQAAKNVTPEEVAGLKFDDDDPWCIEYMVRNR